MNRGLLKNLFLGGIFSVSGVFSIKKVLASHVSGHIPGIDLENPLKFDTLPEVLDAIAGFLFLTSIPLVAVVLIYGGYLLVIAGGNEDRIRSGKKAITWGVIGFIVIVLAGSIANLIKNFFVE